MKQPVIHHHHNNNSVWLPWNEGSCLFQRQDYRERSKVWMDCLFQHCLPVSIDILIIILNSNVVALAYNLFIFSNANLFVSYQ